MEIKFTRKKIKDPIITMGNLKKGCSCWNNSYFNG